MSVAAGSILAWNCWVWIERRRHCTPHQVSCAPASGRLDGMAARQAGVQQLSAPHSCTVTLQWPSDLSDRVVWVKRGARHTAANLASTCTLSGDIASNCLEHAYLTRHQAKSVDRRNGSAANRDMTCKGCSACDFHRGQGAGDEGPAPVLACSLASQSHTLSSPYAAVRMEEYAAEVQSLTKTLPSCRGSARRSGAGAQGATPPSRAVAPPRGGVSHGGVGMDAACIVCCTGWDGGGRCGHAGSWRRIGPRISRTAGAAPSAAHAFSLGWRRPDPALFSTHRDRDN